ncbi:LysM peptidoglycan-binding domain-containing protein [Pseudarthrobacter phenanthrenivorans]|uniref:LysM peptidoglycan-binding domain-containing protein n=1 Tax=Pseudarthrobacter phenanthrenivorans TaxID=361575 RepID=A0A3B0G4K2_PSEPS|nr:LysM peptidoglycan-binding domain-containing protein [Pseudarthrobacter phenanthrenivorans]RKO26729.1 LysM peptidoglycan-binding domain-containing protein [Pseudarthrobacter phenanthrenivorans]
MVSATGPARNSDVLAAAGVLLLGILLSILGWSLMQQWRDFVARHQEPDVEILLAVVAAAAGAGTVVWWFASLGCAAGTVLLDRRGRAGAAAATRRLSPAFMQRLVLGILSVQVLSGPAAQAAPSAPSPEWAPTHELVASAPVIPGTPGPATNQAGPPGTDTIPSIPTSTVQPGWQPAAPAVSPGMLAAPGMRAPAEPAAPEAEGVTVHAGDTLWDIAARHLGPGASDVDIASQWPHWYEANRALIGANPDVLLPGQVLQPPAPAAN